MNIELYVMKTLGLDMDEAISHIEECKYLMNNSRINNRSILDDYCIPMICERDVMEYRSPERNMTNEQFVAYVMVCMDVDMLKAIQLIEDCKDALETCDPVYDDVDYIIDEYIDGLNSDWLLDIFSYCDDYVDDDLIHKIYRLSQDAADPKSFVERWTEYDRLG
jgi:hypothetical protein